MAGWNKPSAANQPAVKKGGVKAPSLMKGVIVGAVAVVVGIVCIFAFSGKSEKPVKDTGTKPAKIKEVTPAVTASTNAVAEVEEKPAHHAGEIWYNEDGKKMITLEKNGVLKDVEVYVRKNSSVPKYRIFKFKSENAIASMLFVPPGTPTFGVRKYKGMTEDFLKSCSVPIVVQDDDDEYTKNLKRTMTEAKISIKEQIDAGANLDDLLSEAREEMKKMAQVKHDIEKLVRESVKNKDLSVEELQDVRDAANKLLADKGIAPLRKNSIVDIRIKTLTGEGLNK